MPLKAIRGKTECPRRVSVSLTLGFDSHRLHYLRYVIARGPRIRRSASTWMIARYSGFSTDRQVSSNPLASIQRWSTSSRMSSPETRSIASMSRRCFSEPPSR